MSSMLKHIELIERIDQLIRLQATGSSNEFAWRLSISRAKLFRVIDTMKILGAPIEYDTAIRSYTYTEPVEFKFGFYAKN